MQRIEAKISGRVQGVGFRQFAADRARAHGVGGWVRNENDGTVRLVAEGERDAVDGLLKDVRKGPSLARVKDIEVRRSDSSGEFDSFRVRH